MSSKAELCRFAGVDVGTKVVPRHTGMSFDLEHALGRQALFTPFADRLVADLAEFRELGDAARRIDRELDGGGVFRLWDGIGAVGV